MAEARNTNFFMFKDFGKDTGFPSKTEQRGRKILKSIQTFVSLQPTRKKNR
jgi:glucuronate isomerase